MQLVFQIAIPNPRLARSESDDQSTAPHRPMWWARVRITVETNNFTIG